MNALQGENFGAGFAGGAFASFAGSGAQWAGWSDAGIVNATTAAGAIGSLAFGGDWYNGASLGFSIGALNHSWRVSDDGYVCDINSWWDNFLEYLGLGSLDDKLYHERTGKELATYPKGTFSLTKNDNLSTVLEIKSSHYAEHFFRTVAFNTNVEWAKITHVGKFGLSHTIVSDHHHKRVNSAIQVHVNNYLKNGERVFSMSHSHPVSDSELYGNMGAWINIDPSDDDKAHASHYPQIRFSVYNLYKKTIQYYNGTGVYRQVRF